MALQEASSPKESIPWPKAHLETCTHSQKLYASPQQVLTHQGKSKLIALPLSRNALIYTGENSQELGQTIATQLQQQQKESEEASKSNSFFRRATAAASSVYTRIVTGEYPDDHEDLDGSVDDYNNDMHDENDDVEQVGWNDRIVNLDLILECSNVLISAIDAKPSDEITFVSLEQQQGDSNFVSWCRQQQHDNDKTVVLQHVTHEEALLLAYILMALDKAQFVTLDSGVQVLALYSSLPQQQELEVQATLFQMDCTMEKNRRLIAEYERKAALQAQRAVEYSKSKQTKQALHAMQVRKRYLNLVQQTENALLKLEQVKLTLEGAHHDQEVLSTLKESTNVLKQVNQETTLEGVDDVMDDLLEQMDSMKIVQQEVAGSNDTMDYEAVDEEELLKELEQLEQVAMPEQQLNNDDDSGELKKNEDPIPFALPEMKPLDRDSSENMSEHQKVGVGIEESKP